MVIPKHFVPPIIVNGILGTVLWTTYSEVSNVLEPRWASHPTCMAAMAGAVAGGAQALVAAPAENLRFAMEGSNAATGWSDAWKEVFRGTQSASSRQSEVHEAREVRNWMKEVGEMAGRGWDGWRWGLGKDICGFAVFFAIFDLTRRVALAAKLRSQKFVESTRITYFAGEQPRRHTPRVVHATTLVTGGVVAGLAYEMTSRPWDAARKAVHLHSIEMPEEKPSTMRILLRKVREEGPISVTLLLHIMTHP